MPFDWMQPKRNASYSKTLSAKREAMYRGELVERAALLHRLGHGKAAVWLARHTPGVVSGLIRLRRAMKRRG